MEIGDNSNEVQGVKLILDEQINDIVQKNPKAQITDIPESLQNDEAFCSKLTDIVKKWVQRSSILIQHSNMKKFDSMEAELIYWDRYLEKLQELKQ